MYLDLNNYTIYGFNNYTNEKDLGALTNSSLMSQSYAVATNKPNSHLAYMNHSGYKVPSIQENRTHCNLYLPAQSHTLCGVLGSTWYLGTLTKCSKVRVVWYVEGNSEWVSYHVLSTSQKCSSNLQWYRHYYLCLIMKEIQTQDK